MRLNAVRANVVAHRGIENAKYLVKREHNFLLSGALTYAI